MLEIDNPFGHFGGTVSGERFIGRKAALQKIESRVVRPPGGNLAIIGQRRVGKSSLASQAITMRRDELLQQRILPVNVAVSVYDTTRQFFCALARICFRQLEELGWDNRQIREAADEIRMRDIERFDFDEFKYLFTQTHNAGIRVIFVLDEFDDSDRFFADEKLFFDRLRQLSYTYETTLLTISRDPIPAIEKRSHITSTLAGTLDEEYLGMYDESEINDHFNRLIAVGVTLTDADRERIVTRCGGHPYLHDKIAFELVELFRDDEQAHVDEALRRAERLFLREFDRISEHLRDRGLLEPLTQALFSSPTRIKPELDELARYGLIRQTDAGYTAFSASFQEYLRQKLPIMIEDLTPAELRVLNCLKNELQNKEIARDLNLGVDTVKTHVGNIIRKLQAKSRHEAVRLAREREIIE